MEQECSKCGEIVSSSDPGDDCVEQFYCDCGHYWG